MRDGGDASVGRGGRWLGMSLGVARGGVGGVCRQRRCQS